MSEPEVTRESRIDKDGKKSERAYSNLPVNSRVFIDYSGEKPTIRFEYPRTDAKHQVGNSSVTYLIGFFLSIFLMAFVLIIFKAPVISPTELFSKSFQIQSVDISSYQLQYLNKTANETVYYGVYVNYTIDGGEPKQQFFKYNSEGIFFNVGKMVSDFSYEFSLTNILDKSIFAAVWIALFCICSWLTSLFFRKTRFGNRIFPKLQKKVHDKKFSAVITPNDVTNNAFLLPLFGNIYLDYHAEGDFSAKLKYVMITEHPFNQLIKKKGKILTEKNIHLWQAAFIFENTPKTGTLSLAWT